MAAIVEKVEQNSIAEDLELKNGDQVISIDGKVLSDFLDYKYAIMTDELELHVKRSDGQEEIIEIEKDFDDDLGITFASAVFDRIRPCTNKCMFCFVDQQPGGLRDSLYIKDDDYRLSYLQGTYVTLTNLTSKERERIQRLMLGPLYVSVHSTNPDLRARMLNNPKAARIIEDLSWLNSIDIPIHAQIVLCPGVNDKKELERTLIDLGKLKSNVMSIAVVPVGITRFRENGILKRVDKNKAKEVIETINQFNAQIGYNLAFPSDEFYILAEENLPDYNFYDDFGQLEDGVGTIRMVLDEFKSLDSKIPREVNKKSEITIATGLLAAKCLKPIEKRLNQVANLDVTLAGVKSNFWGDDITVAGLITGQDLLDEFLPKKNNLETLVIPSVMLRPYTESFLDGLTLSEVKEKLDANFLVLQDQYSNRELVDYIKTL